APGRGRRRHRAARTGRTGPRGQRPPRPFDPLEPFEPFDPFGPFEQVWRVTSAELRHCRIAILGYFFVLGAATATWAARLPAIMQSLHLSDGRLGLALFAVPAGSVLTLALSGRIADRFGAVRVLRIAGVLVPAALIPIGLAGGLVALMVTLAVYGALGGLLDVSMNACGARLELGYDRPIMSSLHAGYSIAGLAGARSGAA